MKKENHNLPMPIYYVGHYGQMTDSITHKLSTYGERDALFIYVRTYSSEPVNDFMERKAKERIDKLGYFVCINEEEFWGLESEEATVKKVLSFYDNLLTNFEISLEFSDVYMTFDEFNSMGIYLYHRNPRATVAIINPVVDRLVSNVDMYRFNEVAGRKFYGKLQRDCRTLSNDGKYLTKVIRTYDTSNLIETPHNREGILNAQKYEYFNMLESRENFSIETKQIIYDFFELERYRMDEGEYNLFLLSSNFTGYALGTSIDEYVYGNQILADYFLGKERMIIKPHPRADIGKEKWEKCFNNALYIPSYLPSECFQYFDLKINKLLTTGSTGGDYIQRNLQQSINLGREYWWNYQYMHKVFISLNIAAYAHIKNIYVCGIPVNMVLCFIKTNPLLNVFEYVGELKGTKNIKEESLILYKEDGVTNVVKENFDKVDILTNIVNGGNKKVYLSFLNYESRKKNKLNDFNYVYFNLMEFYIEKQPIEDKFFGDTSDEKLGIYVFDQELLESISDFEMKYILSNTGLRISVGNARRDELSITKEDLIYKLINKFDHMTKYMNVLLADHKEKIRCIEDIYQYVDQISMMDDLIIISVKDTPGYAITPAMAKHVMKLGIKTDLYSRHWNSYIMVRYKNEIIYEAINQDNFLFYETEIRNHLISIKSAALKVGNVSKIEIDNKNYSMNMRGLNIVVYDIQNKKMIDSVCFDTHCKGIPCCRDIINIF